MESNIGLEVAKFIQTNGYSTAQMCTLCNISDAALRHILSEDGKVTIQVLNKVAKVLGKQLRVRLVNK